MNQPAPKQKPRDHHYVPRFYLKGFTDEKGQLHVFDRYNKRYNPKAPKGIAYQRDYYTVATVDGDPDSPIIEEGYAQVENAAKPIIERLATKPTQLTKTERENLALFMSMQDQRVPDNEKQIIESAQKMYKAVSQRFAGIIATNEQAYESSQKKLKELTGKESNLKPSDGAGLANEEKFKLEVTVPRSYVIKQMLQMALDMAPYIYQMDWKVVYAPEGRAFLTSDNPFVITGAPGRFGSGPGLITPGSVKLFPLNKRACLVLGDRPAASLEFGRVHAKGVRWINYSVALNSDRYIMGSADALVRRVVKTTKADQFLTGERVHVG